MQKRGNARRDGAIRSQEVAALEQVRLARRLALFQRQLRSAFGMLSPE
jgi:hypothetical protein